MRDTSTDVADSAHSPSASAIDLLYPVSEWYERAALPIPKAERVEGWQVPEPERSILVHNRDMTPTLESAYDRTMGLRVLDYSLDGDVFCRQILLIPEGRTKPAVFGAIRIYLSNFPEAAAQQVIERKLPLGTILQWNGIEHSSRPDSFFSVKPDSVIKQALQIDGDPILYGRRNVLYGAQQQVLARVLEILPPSSEINIGGNA